MFLVVPIILSSIFILLRLVFTSETPFCMTQHNSAAPKYILQNDQTVEWLYFTVLVTVPMGPKSFKV